MTLQKTFGFKISSNLSIYILKKESFISLFKHVSVNIIKIDLKASYSKFIGKIEKESYFIYIISKILFNFNI